MMMMTTTTTTMMMMMMMIMILLRQCVQRDAVDVGPLRVGVSAGDRGLGGRGRTDQVPQAMVHPMVSIINYNHHYDHHDYHHHRRHHHHDHRRVVHLSQPVDSVGHNPPPHGLSS
jgi:hypothetical protein